MKKILFILLMFMPLIAFADTVLIRGIYFNLDYENNSRDGFLARGHGVGDEKSCLCL